MISYNYVHYFIHIDVHSSNDGTMTNPGHAMFARDNMATTTSETGYNESEITYFVANIHFTVTIQSDDSDDDVMIKRKPNRVKRSCPLPGCESKAPFVRLANHIRNFHNITSGEERRKWLQRAKQNVRHLVC